MEAIIITISVFASLLFPFLRLGAFLFGGLRLGKVSCENAVSSAEIPVLSIHGDADNFAPPEMSLDIKRAADK